MSLDPGMSVQFNNGRAKPLKKPQRLRTHGGFSAVKEELVRNGDDDIAIHLFGDPHHR